MKFSEILSDVLAGQSLSEESAYEVMSSVMAGELTDAQIAGFLVALRAKGETVDEIVGGARAMRDAALRLDAGDLELVDTCGTGGDRTGTFNVSTAAALIAAGAGVHVAKHGNRSVSSQSGSADVFEIFGVKIDAAPEVTERCIREACIGFLFAPVYHRAMKFAIGPRRQLGIRTVFNVLGPLTNPAGAKRQLLGLFSSDILRPMAEVLQHLGAHKAWIVHSEDGLDELSISAPTYVAEVEGGRIRTFTVDPAELGFAPSSLDAVKVTSAQESARLIRSVLDGTPGPAADLSVLNAAGVIVVAGLAPNIKEAVAVAAASVQRGKASDALTKLIDISNSAG